MLRICSWFVVASMSALSACAPLPSKESGISAGLLWTVSPVSGGLQANLLEADGRHSALLRCQNGLLYVAVHTFQPPMGPTPRVLNLHLGGAPISLALDNTKGLTGIGRPPADIGQQIRNATEFRVELDNQVFGPYIPPTGVEAQALADACGGSNERM